MSTILQYKITLPSFYYLPLWKMYLQQTPHIQKTPSSMYVWWLSYKQKYAKHNMRHLEGLLQITLHQAFNWLTIICFRCCFILWNIFFFCIFYMFACSGKQSSLHLTYPHVYDGDEKKEGGIDMVRWWWFDEEGRGWFRSKKKKTFIEFSLYSTYIPSFIVYVYMKWIVFVKLDRRRLVMYHVYVEMCKYNINIFFGKRMLMMMGSLLYRMRKIMRRWHGGLI